MKNKLMIIGVLILLLIGMIALLLIGTYITTAIVQAPERRWLAQETTCSPPCWEGIIPGVTTREEALSLLDESKMTTNESEEGEELYGSQVDGIVFDLRRAEGQGSGIIGISEETELVNLIVLPFENICLEDAIETFGEPDAIFAPLYSLLDHAYILWEDDGIIIHFYNRHIYPIEPDLCMPENTQYYVYLYEPGLDRFEIPLPYLQSLLELETLQDNYFHPWKGYGEY